MHRFGLIVALLASGCIERTASGDDPEVIDGGQDAQVIDAATAPEPEPDALPEPEPDAPPEPDMPPEPDCEAACERVAQCFNAECTGSPYGDLGAACLQTCADLGAAEFEAQFVCTQGLTESIVPGLAEACLDPEFVADCSFVGPGLTGSGDPAENARRTAAEFDMAKPLLREVYDKVLYAADAPTRAALNAATDWLLADIRVCEFGCFASDIDGVLDAIERTATLLDGQPTHAAQQLNQCLSIVAKRMGWLQYGFTAEVCGGAHGAARAVARLAGSLDATPRDMLCVTRNAHDLCQARYLDVEPLAEPNRCPTCTVGFGETMCEVPPNDTCSAAGECLCTAIGIEGEACELQAFGPRGAIAFGEACGQSDLIGPVVAAGGFDDGNLDRTSSAGCDLMPAVLEDRQCEPQAVCRRCQQADVVPAGRCEPGRAECEVYVECGRRFITVSPECRAATPLCPAGWETVEVCLDDLPCEPGSACGVTVQCQPERP